MVAALQPPARPSNRPGAGVASRAVRESRTITMKARPSAGKPAKADPRRILHQARGVAPARPENGKWGRAAVPSGSPLNDSSATRTRDGRVEA